MFVWFSFLFLFGTPFSGLVYSDSGFDSTDAQFHGQPTNVLTVKNPTIENIALGGGGAGYSLYWAIRGDSSGKGCHFAVAVHERVGNRLQSVF